MNNKLGRQITRRCPILFRDRYSYVMHWGFCVGNGWYQIIYDACVEIEAVVQNIKDSGLDEDRLPIASHIKEKHGTLRFFINNTNQAIDDICDKVEALSEEKCEGCGQPGKLISNAGWVRTHCERCERSYNEISSCNTQRS